MSVATDRVSRRRGVKGGRPTIRESKVSVIQALDLADAGLSPEHIAEEFHDVPSAEAVRDALDWADDNPDEIVRLRERRSVARERLDEVALDV